jgi:hypothetical protein
MDPPRETQSCLLFPDLVLVTQHCRTPCTVLVTRTAPPTVTVTICLKTTHYIKSFLDCELSLSLLSTVPGSRSHILTLSLSLITLSCGTLFHQISTTTTKLKGNNNYNTMLCRVIPRRPYNVPDGKRIADSAVQYCVFPSSVICSSRAPRFKEVTWPCTPACSNTTFDYLSSDLKCSLTNESRCINFSDPPRADILHK